MNYLFFLLGKFVPTAYANGNPFQPYCASLGQYCDLGQFFLVAILDNITMLVFQLIGATSVTVVIIGGIKLITSGEGGKEDAKKMIMYGAIGLALAVVAVTFTRFVCFFATFIFGEDAGALCNINAGGAS